MGVYRSFDQCLGKCGGARYSLGSILPEWMEREGGRGGEGRGNDGVRKAKEKRRLDEEGKRKTEGADVFEAMHREGEESRVPWRVSSKFQRIELVQSDVLRSERA